MPDDDLPTLKVVATIACLTSCFWLVATLPTFSDACVHFLYGPLLILASMVIGLCQFIVWLAVIWHRQNAIRRRAYTGLIAAILIQISWYTDLGFRGRLWLSEEALMRRVEQLQRLRTEQTGPEKVGLFSCDWIRQEREGTIRFATAIGFKGEDRGFLYLPSSEIPESSSEHIFGQWYRY